MDDNRIEPSELARLKLLFSYWEDDPDRQMSGTRFSYYFDDRKKTAYVYGRHDDAASFHGSYETGPYEVSAEKLLDAASIHCPDKLDDIRELFGA